MEKVVSGIAGAVFVFLYIPILAVVIFSFNAGGTGYKFEGVTLRWYVELFQNEGLMSSLKVSFIVALVAATVATLIGTLFSIGMISYKGRAKPSMFALVAVPIIIPEIVLGVALLSLMGVAGISLGYGTLILGHLVFALPLAILVLFSSALMLDKSLPEAAKDLGCTPFQTFTRVYFPLLRPAIAAAWLLSFTTSFSNIVMSTFLGGIGTTTLPIRIYSSLKTGLSPSINAIGALLILLTLVIVLSVGVKQMRRIMVR